MKVGVCVAGALVFISWAAYGGVPTDYSAVHESVAPHDIRGDAANGCTIAYYDLCSGWISVWSAGWMPGDLVGVTFDLPSECDKLPDEICENTGFWWYWRFTYPGYGYTVAYSLYEVDGSSCLVGAPVGTLGGQDPVERWNFYSGLGTVPSDTMAIVVTWEYGSIPEIITDNTAENVMSGCAPIPAVVHSWYFGNNYYVYCPPIPFQQEVGPCNILMDATFSCEATSTEPASWGAVKSLFR